MIGLRRHSSLPSIGLLTLLLSLLTSQCSRAQTTYYVDAVNGSDTNLGTSVALPWKTISKVNGRSFQPGDQILFKRGQTWREQLSVPSSGSPNGQITFGAYGTGYNPVISGADIISGFVQSGNSTTVYIKTAINIQPFVTVYNGNPLRLNGGAGRNIAVGQWDWSSDTLFVNVGQDPATGTVEAGQRDQCISAAANGGRAFITLDGLAMNYGNNFGLNGDNAPLNLVVQNCIINIPRRDGIYFTGTNGKFLNNTICGGATNIQYGRFGIYHEAGNNPTIVGNLISQFQAGVVVAQSGGAINSGRILQNIIHDIDCISPNKAANADLQGIELVGQTGTNGKIVHVQISQNSLYGIAGAAIGVVYADSCTFNYNVIFNCGVIKGSAGVVEGGISLWNYSKQDSLLNNTIFQAADGVQLYNGITNAVMKGNIIRNSNQHGIYSSTTGNGVVGTSENYNCVSGSRLLDWQNVTRGSNSISADPLFANPSGNDFTLQATSPCIDAGTDVGLTKDRLGVQVPQGLRPDIGAFERTMGPLNLNPSSLNFGVVQVGTSKSRMVFLQNKGSSACTVSDILTAMPVFSVSQTSLTIPSGGADTLYVVFKPTTTGVYNTTLILKCSAPLDQLTLSMAASSSPLAGLSEVNNPKSFALKQNYPNPFNPTTSIEFEMPRDAFIKIELFDMTGRLVRTLLEEEKSTGTYRLTLNAIGLASGAYLYKMMAGQFTATRKCILLK